MNHLANHPYLIFLVLVAIAAISIGIIDRSDLNRKTLMVIAILCVQALLVLFRSDVVFSAVNSLFPINHVAWIIFVLAIYIAFKLAILLIEEAGARFPFKHHKRLDIMYLTLLLVTFCFVCLTPEHVNGISVKTPSQLVFMGLYYGYAVYASLGLLAMTYQLDIKEQAFFKHLRWIAIRVGLSCYAIYNSSAFLNILAIWLLNERIPFLSQVFSTFLLLTTFLAIPIFMPGLFYRLAAKIIDRLIKPIHYQIHRSTIFIQEFLYYVKFNNNPSEISSSFSLANGFAEVDSSLQGTELINAYFSVLLTSFFTSTIKPKTLSR